MNFLLKQKKQALFCPNTGKIAATRINTSIKQIMRVSAVLIFLTGISTFTLLASTGKAQELNNVQVSVTAKNESLAGVLRKIEQLTTFHFVYPSAKINGLKVVSISETNLSLARTLDKLLTPLQLTYKQIGDNILIDAVKKNATDNAMSCHY